MVVQVGLRTLHLTTVAFTIAHRNPLEPACTTKCNGEGFTEFKNEEMGNFILINKKKGCQLLFYFLNIVEKKSRAKRHL